jgi:hypothetical protein
MHKIRKLWVPVFFVLLLLLPIVLLLTPLDLLEEQGTVCLSVLIAGLECYACGMFRALMSILNFEFAKAAEYNKLSFIVFPLLVYFWATLLLEYYKKLKS